LLSSDARNRIGHYAQLATAGVTGHKRLGRTFKIVHLIEGESDGWSRHQHSVIAHHQDALVAEHSGQPLTFPLNRVIPGWTEALQKMKVGDKWKLFIPSDLAYGARRRSDVIGPNQVVVFDVELLAIVEGKKDPLSSKKTDNPTKKENDSK